MDPSDFWEEGREGPLRPLGRDPLDRWEEGVGTTKTPGEGPLRHLGGGGRDPLDPWEDGGATTKTPW